jgi:polysaccharide pyruvyl transferase WcaK-like protein
MQPEKWDVQVDKEDAIGINVSGLAYSNTFRGLSGQFAVYPELIDQLISAFQKMGKTIYLIPHSYHFGKPEKSNDDIEACQAAYAKLTSKENVVLIDKWDLTSPQTKYLISQMSFFCGTRMHANYAAIFTKVPVFGFAYSKKFIGAFKRNGIAGRVVMINNITKDDVENIVAQVLDAYHEDVIAKRG